MKHISISTLFVMLAVPFVVICGGMMMKSRPAMYVPDCYKEKICDSAQLLSPDDVKKLKGYQDKLLHDYDIDLRVATATLSPAETINFFSSAKIGKHSKSKRGALLMIDGTDNLVRYQTTRGLEKVYTGEFISYIERNQMVPYFLNKELGQGIVVTSGLILSRAKEATANKEFNPADIPNSQEMAKQIGDVPKRDPSISPMSILDGKELAVPTNTPTGVVAQYIDFLLLKNVTPDLPIYTKTTQMFLKDNPPNIIKMDKEWQIYRNCRIYKEVQITGGLAVVLYDITQRQCAPYFLAFENGQWRLDLVMRNNHINLNSNREWALDMTKPLPYADGFLDWNFNKDGIPSPMKKMRWGLLVQTDAEARVTYIKKVYDHTPASAMQFQAQDVILEWDGMANPTAQNVTDSMDKAPEGQKIHVLFWRNGQKFTVDIVAPPPLN